MRNNSSRAGLHRYKRNLLFPFFALIFALPNLIGCTQVRVTLSFRLCSLLFALYSLFRFR